MMQPTVKRLMLMLFAILYVGKAILFFSFVDCGVDISDEGQLLMGFRYPKEYYTFPYYQFIAPLLGSVLSDILFSRMLKVALEVAFISLISGSIYLWLTSIRQELSGWMLYVEIWLAASLSAFTFVFARVTSYDDFVGVFPSVSLLCLSFVLFRKNVSTTKNILLSASCGLFLGFVCFIKATVFVTVLAAFGFAIWRYKYQHRTQIVLTGSFILAGIVLGLLIGVWLVGGMLILSADFEAITKMSNLSAYNFKFMLANYWKRDAPYLFLIFISCAFVFTRVAKENSMKYWFFWCLINLCFVMLLYKMDINFAAVAEQHVYLFLIFTIASAFGCFVLQPNGICSKRNIAVILFWCFPFLLAAGTANSVFENSSLYMAVFLCLAYVSAAYWFPERGFRYFIVLVVLTTGYFVHTQIFHPYGLPTNILKQNQVALLADNRIVTDSLSASFFNQIYTDLQLEGYKKGDEIIALDALTGIAATVGAKMPLTMQWVNGSDNLNCYFTEKFRYENQKAFLVTGQRVSPQLQNCLSNTLNFPDKYKLVSVIANPYKQTFKIHYGAELSDSVKIYAPVAR